MDKVNFNNLSAFNDNINSLPTYEEKISWIKNNINSDYLEKYLNHFKKENKKDCYRRINKILNNNENSIITMLPEEDLDKMYERRKKDKYEDLDKEASFKVNKIISSYSKKGDPDLNKMYDELLKILPEDSSFYKKIKERKTKLLSSSLMPYESLRKIEKKNKERKMENKEINTNSYNVRKNNDREHPKFDREKIMKATTMLLEAIGDDPQRPGLIGTPDRVARMWEEMFEGMAYSNEDIAKMFNTCFDTNEDNEDLVTIMNIPVFSTCEHHLALMYDMTVSIGYIPRKGRVIGLSKAARVAEMCAHRVQLQEKLGEDIADVMMRILDTPDVIVVIRGKHSCMTARGAKSDAITKTATLKGRFKTVSDLRKEFYSLLDNN